MITDDDAVDNSANERKLALTFPRRWNYTVIGRDEASITVVVKRVVRGIEHDLAFSHESRGGKYRSYTLDVTVSSDEERLRIFRELGQDPAILYTI